MTGRHHHGQQQGRQRRCIGHGRPRERGHQQGRQNGHIAQPPAHMADHAERQVDDSARQSARVHDLAGQHEKGHGQQWETVGAFNQVLRQDLRVKHVQVPHQGSTTEQQ